MMRSRHAPCRRKMFGWGLLACSGLLLVALPAPALRIAYFPPQQRALQAEVVIVGKVTAIEKDTVDLPVAPGAPEKVAHKIAVVRIVDSLIGASDLTHLKIAFVPQNTAEAPPPPADGVPRRPILRPPIRPGFQLPNLKEGDEFLFFLTKHPAGAYYFMPGMHPPISLKDESARKDLQTIKKIAAVLADPLKALKSSEPAARAEAAVILILKYRTTPMFANQLDQVPISAEESRLILQALAAADWSTPQNGNDAHAFQPVQGFYALGLASNDGWNPPKVVPPQPGQPPVDFNKLLHQSFVEWLKGPGKDYRIKKFVAR